MIKKTLFHFYLNYYVGIIYWPVRCQMHGRSFDITDCWRRKFSPLLLPLWCVAAAGWGGETLDVARHLSV